MPGFAFLTLQPVSSLISSGLGKLGERPAAGGAPGGCGSSPHRGCMAACEGGSDRALMGKSNE